MNDYELGLYRYVIQISGKGGGYAEDSERLFNVKEYGAGYVSVFKIAEGRVPALSTEVGHLLYVGGFKLQEKKDKSSEEFMKEIKEGLVKIISENK
ncbi:MAG: hypothetical protein M1416_02035 [Candidatus Pacearchaeota archaeon]|nr:hypothetical protein [Candidatus Pacearchaeota archaeon]